jgi:hypothetical protein
MIVFGNPSVAAAASDSDSETDEDDDEITDIPDIVRQPASLNRRVSVSAESNTKVAECPIA